MKTTKYIYIVLLLMLEIMGSCKERKTADDIQLSFDAIADEALLIPFNTEYVLSCIVTPDTGRTPILEWASSNPEIRIIAQSGVSCTLLSNVAGAVAVITVSAEAKSASLTVQVDAGLENPLGVTLDNTMLPLLFPPQKDVLTGSDGAISIEAGTGKNYWLWGDFFLGEVVNNVRIAGKQLISGNCLTVLDGDISTTFHGGTIENPAAFLTVEPAINGYPTIVWPAHGFVKNGILHVLMSVFLKVGSGGLDIAFHSTQYYRLRISDLTIIDVQEVRASKLSGAHFGYGFVEHEGWYYTYGTKDEGSFSYPLCAARAQLINDKLGNWQVFDGTAWSSDLTNTVGLRGLNNIIVSEQHSIFKYNNTFILLTQNRLGPNIYTFVSDNPEGPWGNKKNIYTTPEYADSRYTTYNAMAHPQYARNDKLLVSYCVNSTTLSGLNSNVMSYRPRFFWIPMEEIMR
jgi:hypothetical protein